MRRKIPWFAFLFLSLFCDPTLAANSGPETISPHAEALQLVFATQAEIIRQVEDSNWWIDVKHRRWEVVRPVPPGVIDSTHNFKVMYSIDSRQVAAWFVNTATKKVELLSHSPSLAPPQSRTETSPHIEALQVIFKLQAQEIRKKETGEWWLDVLPRCWDVFRPSYAGDVDTKHLFYVSYKINQKHANTWHVDTAKQTATLALPE